MIIKNKSINDQKYLGVQYVMKIKSQNVEIKIKINTIIMIVIIFVCIIVNVISWISVPFSDFHRENIFPLIQEVFSRISGIFPFSVGEIMIIAGIIIVLAGLISFSILMVVKKKYRKKIAYTYSRIFLWIIVCILTVETFNFFILYHCTTFASNNNITENEYTPNQLYSVAEMIVGKANEASKLVTRNDDGQFLLTADLHSESIKAMKNLGNTYDTLDGYYPNPKPILFSDIFTKLNLLGIYFPFSMEANYNNNMYSLNRPSTVCHELAHLKGWIQEDEANFIAYLACINSDNPEFVYSGYAEAMEYLWIKVNSECKLSDEKYAEFLNLIDAYVWNDCFYSHEIFRTAQEDKVGTVLAEVSDVAIEASLKLNGVPDGAKSYGRFVDLLLNYYLDENGNLVS